MCLMAEMHWPRFDSNYSRKQLVVLLNSPCYACSVMLYFIKVFVYDNKIKDILLQTSIPMNRPAC